MANFLKDLPTQNAANFTKINPDTCHRSSTSKKTAYIPVKDIPAGQVIVTEKTNILLRYLHQQWDKKVSNKKRAGEATTGPEEGPKKARLETLIDTSNTSGAGVSMARSTNNSNISYTVPVYQGTTTTPYFLPSVHPPPSYPGSTPNQPVNRFANQQ